MTREEIIAAQEAHYLYPWYRQAEAAVPRIVFEGGRGCRFRDVDGRSWLDFSSQLMNLNVGHGEQRIVDAIVAQANQYCYAAPSFGSEPRAAFVKELARILPGDLKEGKIFLDLGGADSVCNAIKMARLWGAKNGGRFKIVCRYRSYHGSLGEADQASGDPRRLPHEPGNPGFVHVLDPYTYRCPFGYAPQGNPQAYIDHVRQIIEFEGPESIAAILMEPVTGTSGLIIPPPGYWKAMRELADEFGFLLIADEVMSGFGRTGLMFATEHDGVVPDILVMAKGLTSGYMPLGAVAVGPRLARFFGDNPLVCGLTYAGHPLSCAAAVATLRVYEQDGLVENSRRMGGVMAGHLARMKERHPCVGDVRSIGLFGAIECVRDRDTREPLSPWNKPQSREMRAIAARLAELGLHTFVRWNIIYCVPPLIVTEAELAEGFEMIDQALAVGDSMLAAA